MCSNNYLLAGLAFLIAFPTAIAAQPPDRKQVIRYAAESGERTWRKTSDPSRSLTSRELFTYALALCEAGMYPERLERLFDLAEEMQVRDPDNPGYGNFYWYWQEGEVRDRNAVEFCMQGGVPLWLRHSEKILAGARDKLREMMEYSIQGCLRHRVSESYTNIALMNAENLILLGEALGKPEVADEGYQRLERICVYTWEAGIHEYCSPTYYGVDLDCLWLIEAFCQRERGREQARALLKLIWTDIALNWFPFSQRLSGARSRDYDYLRGQGHLDTQMWVSGWLPGRNRGGAGSIYPALGRWQPPDSLMEMNSDRFPRLVRQSWGIAKNQSRTNFLLADITLSSAGANYGPMDIPLSVDLPGDREYRRCYFIPDARHDPYGKKKIPAGAHSKTLHLRPFWTAAQRRTDALGLVIYRDRDIPEGSETLESHFVMPRDTDGFWIGNRRIDMDEAKKMEITLDRDDSLVFRRGTAAVGLRIPWTRGLDGGQAQAIFVYDGNEYGAVRLTVAHHKSSGVEAPKANAGAAFWVRIGSGLDSDEDFRQWRQQFMSASAEVEASSQRILISIDGSDGRVVVGTEAPYSGVIALEPAPSRAVLELDGEDIGREILKGIEPIKSYMAKSDAPPVVISVDTDAYWEAESGQVMPPMTVDKDESASGGKYVWMPGKPGEKGGSVLGSVTWRLNIPRSGDYYVWGRVLAPTPEDDSFYVRVLKGADDLIGMSEWHTGTHQQWEWARITLNRAQELTPLALPVGEVRLQLRVREDGTKIDRLFITTDADKEPL